VDITAMICVAPKHETKVDISGSGTLNINITRKLLNMLIVAEEKWERVVGGSELAISNSQTAYRVVNEMEGAATLWLPDERDGSHSAACHTLLPGEDLTFNVKAPKLSKVLTTKAATHAEVEVSVHGSERIQIGCDHIGMRRYQVAPSSHLISSRLVSSRLVSSRLVSSRLVSSRLVSSRLVSSRLVSSHLISSRLVPCRAVPCRAVPCQLSARGGALPDRGRDDPLRAGRPHGHVHGLPGPALRRDAGGEPPRAPHHCCDWPPWWTKRGPLSLAQAPLECDSYSHRNA
jgi:hypothetical protein